MTIMTKEARPATTDPQTRETQATIASVSDQDFWIARTYGLFHISACAPGESSAVLEVTSREDAIDIGDNRRFPFRISARAIAADIIQDLEDHGIFICAAAQPSSEEVAAACAKRDAWYTRLVNEADEMWARGHSYREISDMHRRAAKSLGLEREWAYVPQRAMDCPACGEKVRAGVAICKHCNATLDPARAAQYFPNGPRDKSAGRSGPAANQYAPTGAHAPAGRDSAALRKPETA